MIVRLLNLAGWRGTSCKTPFLLVLAGLLGFALPASTALTNILMPLLSLVGLWLGRRYVAEILRQPVVWFALLIFVALAVGVFYSPVPNAVNYLSKYRKVLFLPLLAVFFLLDRRLIAWSLGGFLLGNTLTLVLSTYVWFGNQAGGFALLTSLGGHNPVSGIFKNPIAQSLLMALAGATAAILALLWKSWRVPLLLLASWMLLNDLLMSPQRIGYLAVLVLMGWCGLVLAPARAKWLILAGGAALLILIGATNNPIAARVGLGVGEIAHCIAVVDNPVERTAVCNTSMGLRTYFYVQATARIKASPWIGHGTGNVGIPSIAGVDVGNPHDEYLMQGVQTGVIGIFLYVAMLVSGFLLARRLSQPWAALGGGVLLVYAAGSLVNSFLLDVTEGSTLIVLLSALLAAVLARKPSFSDQG